MKPVVTVTMPHAARSISRQRGASDTSRVGCGIISRGKGQQFEYGHDDIGNRKSTKAGGDSVGSALRSASYSANTLNQYTSRDVPNAFDVLGASHATNSVTVNASPADYRRGEYFQELVSVVNSSTSVWQRVAVTNTGGSWSTGNVFVAKTAEAFTYDADGNLTSDGRWTYAWDAENRLINMTSGSSTPTGSKFKLDFAYDWKGRRIEKQVSTNNGSGYFAQYTNRYVYDGWNLLAVLAPNSQLQSCFIWGLDLSGSMQGAGGVGGLLAVKDATNGVHFCAYDGNGNVAALLNADGSGLTAQYEYGPFGEVLRSTGTMAKTNPFRFSTKYQDDESDMLYYGFRSYNPSTGRWLSRDPIGERGGKNPYGFVRNNPAFSIDILGLIKGTGKYANCSCVGWKETETTVVVLAGANGLTQSNFRRANDVYEQACVRIRISGLVVLGPSPTTSLIGDDYALDVGDISNIYGQSTDEERKLASYRVDGHTHAYFVKTSTAGEGLRGIAFPDWMPAFESLYPAFVVFNSAVEDTYAHEFGHVLGLKHKLDADNLMAPGVLRNFTDQLTEKQADTIRASNLVHD